ncbi:MAG TPA: hemerythrin domain-containing protein [Anaerolineales bacterium]|nr:hemerythrin domain-containing protein [Anaerolineales bacterium]
MHITKSLRADQELILRFLDTLGGGSVVLSNSRQARPGLFIFAHTFIQEYIEANFFKKEALLITALENSGFPLEEGPVGAMLAEQKKSHEAAEHMLNAARGWQAGDAEARAEVGWAASEYTSTLRQHLDRLKNLIFPLLEQNLSPEDEHKIAEGLNTIAFESSLKGEGDKYVKLIESLEDELSDWR